MRFLDKLDNHVGKLIAFSSTLLAGAKVHFTPDVSEKIAHTIVLLITALGAGTALYHKYLGKKARRNSKPRNGSVLIVDDNESDCILFSRDFQKLQCEVTCVHTHDEAKKLLESDGYHYDLILVDIRMPGEDLVGLFQFVKKEQPQIDIVLMSQTVTTATIEKIGRHGQCLFIQKPVGNISGFAQYVVNSFKLDRFK